MAQQDIALRSVDLEITRKFFNLKRGSFEVKDAVNDNVLFKVEDTIFTLHDRRVIRDAAGNIVLTLWQKILTAHYTWQVYKGDSTDETDLLFSAKTSTIYQLNLKTIINVFLAKNTSMEICDYKVEVGWSENSCVIYAGEFKSSTNVVAQMNKRSSLGSFFLGKDKFNVTVFSNTDQALIVALIVILDDIVSNHGLRCRLGPIIRGTRLLLTGDPTAVLM